MSNRFLATGIAIAVLCGTRAFASGFDVSRCPYRPAPTIAEQVSEALLPHLKNQLTAAQAQELEDSLRTHPDDPIVHAKLVSYHHWSKTGDSPARVGHLLWLVEHVPDALMLGSLTTREQDSPGAEALRTAWLAAANKPDAKAQTLANAGQFLTGTDPQIAEQFLLRAIALDRSSSYFPNLLGHMYQEEMKSQEGPERLATAHKAFHAFETALNNTDDPYFRTRPMEFAMNAALDAEEPAIATSYARLLLDLTERQRGDPEHIWGMGDAAREAHIVLGRIALRAGDVSEAKHQLLQAAPIPGDEIAFAGPDVVLARELLEHGERDAVLTYLDASGRLWTKDSDAPQLLSSWRTEIQAGRIPDFEARPDDDP